MSPAPAWPRGKPTPQTPPPPSGRIVPTVDVPGVIVLADAPGAGRKGKVKKHPIARLGNYSDRRYGAFAITDKDYAGWVKTLELLGEIPIDYDHSPEKDEGTEAAGWIRGLDRDGRMVVADIEWTPQGAQAIRDKRWRYISPTFVDDLKIEGKAQGHPGLKGAGLTNRPYLRRGMPAISLSDDADFPVEFAEPDDDPRAPDSPDQMPDLVKIAEALGLDKDADEAKVLEAIAEKAKTSEPEPSDDTKTLEERAKAEGKTVVDTKFLSELAAQAKDGADAATKLHAQTWDTAWDKARDRGAVDAKDETKEFYKTLYDGDEDTGLKALSMIPDNAAFPAGPAGKRGNESHVDTSVPGGEEVKHSGGRVALDEDRAELAQKAIRLSEEKDISFEDALDRLERDGAVAA